MSDKELQTTQNQLANNATANGKPDNQKSRFVALDNGHITGELEDGLKVGEQRLKTFEMRDCLAGDMFDAENNSSVDHYITYRAALVARQLVKLGDLTGPIDFELLRNLSTRDMGIFLDALDEVEALGKQR